MKRQSRVFTDGDLRKMRAPETGRYEEADMGCRGLSVRITPNDVRTWNFRYVANGKVKRVEIGRYPSVKLATARLNANKLRADIASGIDPVASKREQKIEARSTEKTFSHLAQRYMDEHAYRKKRPRSAEEDRRNLAKHMLPYWADRPYAELSRADIVKRIEQIAKTHPIAANRNVSLISKVMKFAIRAGLMTTTPCLELEKPGKERAKERVLDDAELRLFWEGIVQSPCTRQVGLALRLTLVTGMRVGEVANLERSDLLDFDDPNKVRLELSAEKVKGKRPLLLPLSPLAHEILDEALSLSSDPNFVFSAVDRLAIESHSLTTAMRRFSEQIDGKEPGMKTWQAEPPTPHDLRRTAATRIAGLGFDERIIARILNHSMSRDAAVPLVTSRHYNLHPYTAEKRQALEAWARELQGIVSGKKTRSNVIPMQAGSVR